MPTIATSINSNIFGPLWTRRSPGAVAVLYGAALGPARSTMPLTDDVYLFGNDYADDALFDAGFSKISIHQRLCLLLDCLACNGGTALPTKSYRVGLLPRYGVQGTSSVEITRSSMDARSLHDGGGRDEYVYMNV